MAHITFTKATEFLAEQLQAGNNFRRVGIVVRATLGGAVDVTKQLDDLFQGAWDKLDAVMERKLADFKDENQRAAILFSYAGSLRLPIDEQLRMLERGKHSESVTAAAAQQWGIAPQVQEFLLKECFYDKHCMARLAKNKSSDLGKMEILASHPDHEVRLALAANLGPQMRIIDNCDNPILQSVYNTLVMHYESDFAHYLVPTCRDEKQLAIMYALTTKTPEVIRPFVENPFTSEQVLLDISSLMKLRMIPGGSAVASEAKQQLEKRLTVESDFAHRID